MPPNWCFISRTNKHINDKLRASAWGAPTLAWQWMSVIFKPQKQSKTSQEPWNKFKCTKILLSLSFKMKNRIKEYTFPCESLNTPCSLFTPLWLLLSGKVKGCPQNLWLLKPCKPRTSSVIFMVHLSSSHLTDTIREWHSDRKGHHQTSNLWN